MMTSNGPPTPKGVGGPPPPLVSRGSEEEWEMEIPTAGSPSGGEGGGSMTPHTQGGGMVPAPDGGRKGLFLNREKDDEPPEATDHPLTQEGGNEPPLPVRAEDRTKEGKWTVIRTGQKNRHDELTRAGNYAC